MTDKNLGHATAYGYAKSKGYTGTEEEFAELMASYAEVAESAKGYAEQAEQSASNAQTSATNASASATTAGTKASEASASALSAQQSATSASTSAGNANASANSASASAQTATTKASEASASATSASESATSANSAKEDAVTAKEEAQASAEEAKASEEAIDLALAKLDASLITDSATGNPSVFPDGANLPVKSLTAQIEPSQDLNGYDYPWVGGAGTNKYDESKKTGGLIDANGSISTSDAWYVSDYCEIPIGTTKATLSWESTSSFYQGRILAFDSSKAVIADSFATFALNSTYSHTFDVPSTAKYVRINYSHVITGTEYPRNNVRLNVGSTDLGYAPYENICPITGHDEVNVTRTGKNLLNISPEYDTGTTNAPTRTYNNGILSISGNVIAANTPFYRQSVTEQIKRNGSLCCSYHVQSGTYDNLIFRINDYNENGTVARRLALPTTVAYQSGHTYEILLFVSIDAVAGEPINFIGGIQLELGTTATSYEPYQSQTVEVTLNDTTYGGTLNVTTGELVATHKSVDLGTLAWQVWTGYTSIFRASLPSDAKTVENNVVPDWFTSCYVVKEGTAVSSTDSSIGQLHQSYLLVCDSRYTDASVFKTGVTGQTLVYELAEPLTYQLTASQLSTLLGTNVISADSGAVTVEYYADTKLYINKVVANAQS